MGYSRKTSNYLERIVLSNPTHMISIADSIDISVETLRIDDGERDPPPPDQETIAIRVQPDRRAKTKASGFRYTA